MKKNGELQEKTYPGGKSCIGREGGLLFFRKIFLPGGDQKFHVRRRPKRKKGGDGGENPNPGRETAGFTV